jgi:uncharacterized membrane protein
MSEIPFQRRLSRLTVRTQARMEAGVGDRWIPNVVTVVLGFALVNTSLARLHSLGTGVDLAGYSQALWLLGQGKMPRASLFGTNVHLLELHWSFVMYPLALLVRFFPAVKVLLVAQGVALAAAVLPLWRLARKVADLRVGAATCLVLAYALHPATHILGTVDFHPESLAVPVLIGMAYFGAMKRWVPYWLCIALALACRADLGLVVALWGFVVMGQRARTVGLWTLGVGLVWTLGLLLVVQPLVGDAGVESGLFTNDGTSLGDVVISAFTHPVGLAGDLVSRDNIVLIVGLLTPVIFLPLLSMRYLAPALPLAVLYLSAGLPSSGAFAGRGSMLLAMVMIAATFALNRLGTMGVDRVFLDARILSTLLAASVLSFVASSPTSPYLRPWNWADRDATDEAELAALATLDPEVPVRASPTALAQLADRPWLFALDPNQEPSAAQAGFPEFTRAVLVVEREIPNRSPAERNDFDQAMSSQGFTLVINDQTNGVALYTRPARSSVPSELDSSAVGLVGSGATR